MKVKIEFTRHQFFTIEADIDNEDEILEWVNEGRPDDEKHAALTGEDIKDWLESSADEWEPDREPTWRDEAGPTEHRIDRVIV